MADGNTSTIDGGVQGYDVHPTTLQQAGAASIQVGAGVAALTPEVDAASQVQQPPAGWTISANLRNVVPHWQNHLRAVADSLQRNGSALESNASTYVALESKHAETFTSLH